MSNIACCCKHESYKVHRIACNCANVQWTVLRGAMPAERN